MPNGYVIVHYKDDGCYNCEDDLKFLDSDNICTNCGTEWVPDESYEEWT